MRIWLSLAVPMAATVPPAILFGASQLWLDRRRAVYFADQSALLQQFQAPGLGGWIARHPDFLAKPLRCEAAVVFIDLSGFTGVSEVLGPNAVRELRKENRKARDFLLNPRPPILGLPSRKGRLWR